jgi:hypothetical protein
LAVEIDVFAEGRVGGAAGHAAEFNIERAQVGNGFEFPAGGSHRKTKTKAVSQNPHPSENEGCETSLKGAPPARHR